MKIGCMHDHDESTLATISKVDVVEQSAAECTSHHTTASRILLLVALIPSCHASTRRNVWILPFQPRMTLLVSICRNAR